jgi:phosphoserine phosphatase
MDLNLVIVDLDKTLIHGDSIVVFSEILIDLGLLSSNFWKKNDLLDSDNHYFSLNKRRILHEVYSKCDDYQKKDVLNRFLSSSKLGSIREVISEVTKYRSKKYKILVTTASLDFLVLPLLKNIKFSFDYLHCSSFDNFSSDLISTSISNSGIVKLQNIKNFFNKIGFPNQIVVFSDHFSDLPILLLGTTSYVVRLKNNNIDDWSYFFNFKYIDYYSE